jgi:hypothetical protein
VTWYSLPAASRISSVIDGVQPVAFDGVHPVLLVATFTVR